jgi:hypothetical protein
MPKQRKRRRERYGEIAGEEESAAFHLIARDSSHLEKAGPAFPRTKASNHFLPRRPLVASAGKGAAATVSRDTADLNKVQAEKGLTGSPDPISAVVDEAGGGPI